MNTPGGVGVGWGGGSYVQITRSGNIDERRHNIDYAKDCLGIGARTFYDFISDYFAFTIAYAQIIVLFFQNTLFADVCVFNKQKNTSQ